MSLFFSDAWLFIVLHRLSLVVGHRLLTVVVSLVLEGSYAHHYTTNAFLLF